MLAAGAYGIRRTKLTTHGKLIRGGVHGLTNVLIRRHELTRRLTAGRRRGQLRRGLLLNLLSLLTTLCLRLLLNLLSLLTTLCLRLLLNLLTTLRLRRLSNLLSLRLLTALR